MQYIGTYRSPLGGITMAASEEGLTGLWFDGQKYFGANLDQSLREEEVPVFVEDAEMVGLLFSGAGA